MPPTIFWNTTADGQAGGKDGGDRGQADGEGHRHADQEQQR